MVTRVPIASHVMSLTLHGSEYLEFNSIVLSVVDDVHVNSETLTSLKVHITFIGWYVVQWHPKTHGTRKRQRPPMARGKRMIQHRPTNDLNLGSCNRYRSKPLSNCNARSQIGTARHELVETPVGRHRSIRRPVHVRSSQNVLPVDSRSTNGDGLAAPTP